MPAMNGTLTFWWVLSPLAWTKWTRHLAWKPVPWRQLIWPITWLPSLQSSRPCATSMQCRLIMRPFRPLSLRSIPWDTIRGCSITSTFRSRMKHWHLSRWITTCYQISKLHWSHWRIQLPACSSHPWKLPPKGHKSWCLRLSIETYRNIKIESWRSKAPQPPSVKGILTSSSMMSIT